MNRSQQIRKVYAELRHEMGANCPAGDLLEVAALLVTASQDTILNPVAAAHEGRLPVHCLPVNEVIESHSWKLVADMNVDVEEAGYDDPLSNPLLAPTFAVAA